MPRFLYSVFFYFLLPAICLRLLWRSLRTPAYRQRWFERFGYFKLTGQNKIIWLHAVSVGETIAAAPLVKSMQTVYPTYRFMITTTTPTGSDRVRALFGDAVEHCYAPYDLPGAVARFLDKLKPEMLIIMETELWPNTIAACYRRNIPVVLANARLSEKSFEAYRRVRRITQPMLKQLSLVAAQHGDDAQRFSSLGLPEEAISVTGNLKFDLSLDDEIRLKASALRVHWQANEDRFIFLAASTHKGEDEQILEAFGLIKRQLPNVLLVLVPRHPERFESVAHLCKSAGFLISRRSDQNVITSSDIVLGDTMGELNSFYGAADIAFVGGSLVPTGGHNIIEPAVWGIPILSGPHLFNFAESSRLMIDGGGLLLCDDAQQLAERCLQLLQNPSYRSSTGSSAQKVAEMNGGAISKLLYHVEKVVRPETVIE